MPNQNTILLMRVQDEVEEETMDGNEFYE